MKYNIILKIHKIFYYIKNMKYYIKYEILYYTISQNYFIKNI